MSEFFRTVISPQSKTDLAVSCRCVRRQEAAVRSVRVAWWMLHLKSLRRTSQLVNINRAVEMQNCIELQKNKRCHHISEISVAKKVHCEHSSHKLHPIHTDFAHVQWLKQHCIHSVHMRTEPVSKQAAFYWSAWWIQVTIMKMSEICVQNFFFGSPNFAEQQ